MDDYNDILEAAVAKPRRVKSYDEDSALDLISQHESGGRNIKQQVVGPKGGYNPSVGRVTGPSSASGPWQITNSTWRKRAPKEIAQQYPSAMSAPVEVQRTVARKIFRETGFQDWAPYNASLRRAIARGEQPRTQTQAPAKDDYADVLAAAVPETAPAVTPPSTRTSGRGSVRRQQPQAPPAIDPSALASEIGGAVMRGKPAGEFQQGTTTGIATSRNARLVGRQRTPQVSRADMMRAEEAPQPGTGTYNVDPRLAKGEQPSDPLAYAKAQELVGRTEPQREVGGIRAGATAMGPREQGIGERIYDVISRAPGIRSLDTPMGVKTDPIRGALSLGVADLRRTITPEEKLIDPDAEAKAETAYQVGSFAPAVAPYVGVGKLVSKIPSLNAATREAHIARSALTFGGVELGRELARSAQTGEPLNPKEVAISTAIGGGIGGLAGVNPGLKKQLVAFITPGVVADVARGTDPETATFNALTNLAFGLHSYKAAPREVQNAAKLAVRGEGRGSKTEANDYQNNSAASRAGELPTAQAIPATDRAVNTANLQADVARNVGRRLPSDAGDIVNAELPIQRGVARETQTETQPSIQARVEGEKPREQAVANVEIPATGRRVQPSTEGVDVSNRPTAEQPDARSLQAPRHVDLQPRRARNTASGTRGQFKKEPTKADAEARRQQVQKPKYDVAKDAKGWYATRGGEKISDYVRTRAEAETEATKRMDADLHIEETTGLTTVAPHQQVNQVQGEARKTLAQIKAEQDAVHARGELTEIDRQNLLTELQTLQDQHQRLSRAAQVNTGVLDDAQMRDAQSHADRLAQRITAIKQALAGKGTPPPPAQPAPPAPLQQATMDLADWRKGGYVEVPVTYLRFGDLPEGKSGRYLEGKRTGDEAGVSVYAAWKDPRTGKYVVRAPGDADVQTLSNLTGDLEGKYARKIYEVEGRPTKGTGGDEEPLIEAGSGRVIREVKPDELVSDDEPRITFAGRELEAHEIPDWTTPKPIPPSQPSGVAPAGKPTATPTTTLDGKSYRLDEAGRWRRESDGKAVGGVTLERINESIASRQGGPTEPATPTPTAVNPAQAIIQEGAQRSDAVTPSPAREAAPKAATPALQKYADQAAAVRQKLSPDLTKVEQAAIERKAARLEAKARGEELRRSGADPYELIDDIIIRGGELIREGKSSFDEWSRKMREEFGKDADPHLRGTWKSLRGEDAESTTSARKAQFAEDRAELDLPELPAAERKSWQTTLNNAKPEKASVLADEVLTKPRALNDEETASLVVRAQQIKNDHSRVLKEIGDASDPDLIQTKRSEMEALEREFDRITDATKKSGTEKGRALASQKLTINQDFDLVSVLQRAKAIKGRELSAKERTKFEDMTKQIEELTTKLADSEKKVAENRLQKQIDRLARTRKREETFKVLDDEFAALKTQFAKAKLETRSGIQASGLASLDPEGVLTPLILKMARNRVKRGVTKAEQVVDEVYSAIKEHVEGVSKDDIKALLSQHDLERDPLPAIKTRLRGQEADLTRRLEEKDFSPIPRRKTIYDKEASELKARVEGLKRKIENEIRGNDSRLDTVLAMRKAGMLTGLRTHMRNVGGTGAFQISEEVSRLPGSIADLLVSTVTKQRALGAPNPVAVARSSYEAATKGLREAKQIMKYGSTEQEMAKFERPRELNSGSKIIDTYVNTVFRTLSAEDKVFRTYAYKRSILEQAKLRAKEFGKSAKELEENPTAEMVSQGLLDAEVSTFNNANKLAEGVEWIRRRSGPVGSTAIDLALPFRRTPANIASRLLESTPLGAVKAGGQLVKAAINKKMSFEEQRRFSQTIGRSVTGSGLILLGYKLAEMGLATGLSEDDAGDREVQKAAGRSPLSIKIGDNWHQIGAFSPMGNLIAVGAALHREQTKPLKEGEEPRNMVTAAAPVGAKVLLEQPFLKGASGVVDAIKEPGSRGSALAGQTVGSFVPTMASDIGSLIDNKRRQARSIPERVQARIPGLRSRLPEDVDVFARPLQSRRTAIIDPTLASKNSDEPFIKELVRLDVGVPKTNKRPGETDEQLKVRRIEQGKEMARLLSQTVSSREYRRVADVDKIEMLKNVIEQTRKAVNAGSNRPERPRRGGQVPSQLRRELRQIERRAQ